MKITYTVLLREFNSYLIGIGSDAFIGIFNELGGVADGLSHPGSLINDDRGMAIGLILD